MLEDHVAQKPPTEASLGNSFGCVRYTSLAQITSREGHRGEGPDLLT